MGRAKQQMMEDDERGWRDLDGEVCEDCVEDDFLKEIIRGNLCSTECSFCGKSDDSEIAAPANLLMEPIASAVFRYFNEPTRAGVPWDGGPLFRGVDTADMLFSLPLHCDDKLFEAIEGCFLYDEWIASAGGNWASSQKHEALQSSWQNFVATIKHRTRFNFANTSSHAKYHEDDPQDVLVEIGKLVRQLNLVKQVEVGTKLFRVREYGADWKPSAEQMGAPPVEVARAGRMNPAGISYLYCAFDEPTALAETMPLPPSTMWVATLEVVRQLNVLDLCSLPVLSSVFDDKNIESHEAMIFLLHFIREISRPVRKGDGVHIDYVPSQVVSEWFALVFKTENNESLNGLIYPSAVAPGGRNLVLFPSREIVDRGFSGVRYNNSFKRKFLHWGDIVSTLRRYVTV